MNKVWLYNPFIYIAGWRAFMAGLLGLLIVSYLSFLTGTHFYGLTGVNFASDSPLWLYALEHVSQWLILSVAFYLAALVFSKSNVRLIDIFGTVLLSKIVLIITPLLRLLPPFQTFVINSTSLYVVYGFVLLSITWNIALTFNAFKVSSNLKEEKLIISVIVCLIISEILTRILLLQIN